MDSNSSAIILCIETSTDICSVALSANGSMVGKIVVEQPRMQTARLAPMVEDILLANNLKVKDLSAVAVSSGPGSYTGLRVGVSMAKGLCFGAGIGLIGVGTLDLLAVQGIECLDSTAAKPLYVVPMIDARRMEVYQAVYQADGKRISEIEPLILTGDSYKALLEQGPVLFCGNGCEKFAGEINSGNAIFLPCSPSAEFMAQLAYQKFISKEFEDVAYMEPFYLKEFEIGKSKKKILG